MKIVKKNQPKIVIFTALKNRCMLHGPVFVMILLAHTIMEESNKIDFTNKQQREPQQNITKTSPCNEYPLTSHFYIVKFGFTGVYIIFFVLL